MAAHPFRVLSGFDDFQFIHQASKSPLYHGYLLKMEGDEVVLNKIDQEIAQCAAEARAELSRRKCSAYARMQGFCSALRWKVCAWRRQLAADPA